MKITAIIHTYNAERYLRQSLESVKDFDELLLIDMYSTDKTLEIAREYGCRIIMHENVGFADPARDFGLTQSTNDWVLVVDSDEVIPNALRRYAYDFAERENNGNAGLYIARKNFFMGRFMRGAYPDYQLRLFRKSVTHWPSTVHSRPQVAGAVTRIPRRRKELAMIHLIEETVQQKLKKINTYTDMEVIRRRGQHYSIFGAYFRSVLRFFQAYVLKGGFRDGKAGFTHAVLLAVYKFTTIAKLWEQDNSRN